MMAEQLWRFARGFVLDDLTNEEAATIRRYLEPVSPSALLIEDGYEVIENCQWCPEERVTLPQGTGCDHGSIPCSVVLRAAVGEGSINPKDGLIPNGGSVQ
jgi:hypothetical protein